MSTNTNTFGPDYNEQHDGKRIATQHDRILLVMHNNRHTWLTLPEIVTQLQNRYPANMFPACSLSAQLRHLRKKEFGSWEVPKRRRGNVKSGLWEYNLGTKKIPLVSTGPSGIGGPYQSEMFPEPKGQNYDMEV